MSETIALLPMKAHSERVPNKNIRFFNGKPLYSVVLEKLVALRKIDEIIVNTDSFEIAEKATKISSKVKIHIRPEELIGDFVSMNEIINYDIENSKGDIYIQTHSTNPLIRNESINQALEFFEDYENYDSIFSVTKHNARFFFEDLKPVNHNPEELLRTQDLRPLFEENSCFYIFSKNSFQENGNNRIGKKPYPFMLDKLESVDIDEEDDFILAEMIHNYFEKYQ